MSKAFVEKKAKKCGFQPKTGGQNSQHPHLKRRRLWRNTCRHEIRMSYPHPHSGTHTVEIYRSPASVQNDSLLRHIELNDRGEVTVTNRNSNEISSGLRQNAAGHSGGVDRINDHAFA